MAAWGEGRLGPQQQPWSREAGGGFSPPLPAAAAEPQKRRPRDPRTSDSRLPASSAADRPPSCWARPWALVWVGPQERGPGRSGPGRAAPLPAPPPTSTTGSSCSTWREPEPGASFGPGPQLGGRGGNTEGFSSAPGWPRLRGRVGSGTLEVAPGSGPSPCSPGTGSGGGGASLPGVCAGPGQGSLGARVNYGRAWAGQAGHWRGPGQAGTARP